MALKKCPDCGKMVSSRAESCPECGCPAEFFEEIAQENASEAANKDADGSAASGGQKEGFKKHVLSIEKVDDIYVLFMMDDGKEIRISENENGLSAIGYLETEQYVFYILDKVEYGRSIDKYKLYRYNKSTKNRKCIREEFKCEGNCCGNDFDLEKSCNNDINRYLFAADNLLFYYDFSAIHRMDFDGENDRIIVEDAEGICWIHNNVIWFYINNRSSLHSYEVGCYSLVDKSQQVVDEGVKGLCTDGDFVYLCNYHKIIRMNMDGTCKEDIATGSFESEFVHVYDMKIENDILKIMAGIGVNNKLYEIHKGDRFMFSVH